MQKTLTKVEGKPKTISEQIEALFEKYIDTTGAIMDDYVADHAMIHEVSIADQNLKEKILNLVDNDETDIEDGEADFDSLLEKIKEHDDFDADKILELVDIDDVLSFVSGTDYISVQVTNIKDRDKIEEFLKTEIYPFVSDQNCFITM